MCMSITGVIGDSNTRCYNTSTPLISGTGGAIGSSCASDSNCLYEKCRGNVCVAPALACPTNTPGEPLLSSVQINFSWFFSRQVLLHQWQEMCIINEYQILSTGTACSGNGACTYLDPSGSVLLGCTILNVTCTATCACNTGFGGKDCSLTSTALSTRDSLRYHTTIHMRIPSVFWNSWWNFFL